MLEAHLILPRGEVRWSSTSGKSQQGGCFDVICSIRARCRRYCWRGHVGSGDGADNNALNARVVVNYIVEDRRRLEVDIEAMESGKDQVGQREGKMG